MYNSLDTETYEKTVEKKELLLAVICFQKQINFSLGDRPAWYHDLSLPKYWIFFYISLFLKLAWNSGIKRFLVELSLKKHGYEWIGTDVIFPKRTSPVVSCEGQTV